VSVGVWEDDKYAPEYWEEAFFLEGDVELDFRANARGIEEQPEGEDDVDSAE
jgi:hypothetical protein